MVKIYAPMQIYWSRNDHLFCNGKRRPCYSFLLILNTFIWMPKVCLAVLEELKPLC